MFFPITETSKGGLAFVSQNVNSAQVVGAAIVEPWKIGRQILFAVTAGVLGASDIITLTPKLRRKGTSTYDTIKDKNGNDLTFDVQIDAGNLDAGVIFGSLDFDRIHVDSADGAAYDYDAIVLCAINAVGANVVVASTYRIFDLYTNRSADNDADQLRYKMHPSGVALY